MRKLLAILLLASSAFAQQQVQPVAGVLTLNLVPGTSSFKVILSANVTSVVIQNPTPGTIISVIFTENATGGFTVAFGGNIANPCTVSTNANATTTCQFQYDATSNTWNGIGSGGAVPGQFSVKTYGAVGDAKHSNNCQFNNSTTLTCADNPFASSDVGKLIMCVYAPTPTNETPAGTTITAFTSASTVTISNTQFNGGAVTGACTWATQDDAAAFNAAFTAALPAGATSRSPLIASPTLSYPGTVVIPCGGYMVNGSIYDFNAAGGNTFAPSFVGAGSKCVFIYPRSDTFTAGARAALISNLNGQSFTWSGFSIFGSGWGFNCGASTIPLIRLNTSVYFILQDILISGNGCTNGSSAILNFVQVQNAYVQQVNITGSSANNQASLFRLDNTAGTLIEQSFFSNNTSGSNVIFNATGVRNASGQQVSMVSGGSDECGGGAAVQCVQVTNASFVNFVGGTIFGEPTGAGNGALTVDGTSGAYLTSMNIGPFSTATNSTGLAIASGGFVYATGSHIRGGGTTGSVIDAPAGATFIDDGGNVYQRCNGASCTNITPAQYSGAFTSGIVPKSSLTHTPNTCYAVTGNLLATAQNLCVILLDQNYQVLNITAQSGGTTPANSSCTGAPVVTLSDGTRTATLTMTTGKAAWSSAVDVSTVNSVFASGATLTVSIGANTCVTPPANVSVNYVLQSVLNQ